LAKLKNAVGWKANVFDWAVCRLPREDKIVIIAEGRTFRVGLKGTKAKAAEAK
jgi:hypothetical protein